MAATTRLRRTFAYPTESDSDDPPDLDEEHQEALLTTLQSQDEATSTLYRHLFLALPVLTALAYIPAFAWASGAAETVVALLNVGVPALAAWILWVYPIGVPGSHGLRSLYGSSGRGEMVGGGKVEVRWLIAIGAGLAGLLVLQSGVLWWAVDSEARAVVPAVVYFLTLFMRQQLAPVDLEELRKARYELKGA
ncbi:hypothetical protein Q7P35_001023 [Cladosporium inversicolor]